MSHPASPADLCGRLLISREQGPTWLEHLPPHPQHVDTARRHAWTTLADHDRDHAYTVALVVSELVTNAFAAINRHARPGWHPDVNVGVQHCTRWDHLYVVDPVVELPASRAAGEEDEDGRGLQIVRALCALLITDLRGHDKTVHAIVMHPGETLTDTDLERLTRR